MSKFLKLKLESGETILINAAQISSVTANGKGTLFDMQNGDVHVVKDGILTVGNRLATLGVEVA